MPHPAAPPERPAPAPGRRPADARRANRALVMAQLRAQPTGRADLARALGLSKTALGDLTQDLLAQGLLSEQARVPARRGRRPAPLRVNARRAAVVGVDLAFTAVSFGVYDLAGDLLHLERAPSGRGAGRRAVYAGLLGGVRRALRQAAALGLPVAALGVASPGPLDARAGVVLDPPMFPELRGLAVRDRLGADTGLPVQLERDTTAAAGAHLRLGGAADFIYLLMLGHGIGAGLVLDRRVFRGAHGYAGEFGHVSLDVHGPACPCGNRGCLERLADAAAVEAAYMARSGRSAGFAELVARAGASDPDALAVFAEAGRAIGLAAVNLVNLFDPSALVLGGLAAPAAPFLLPAMRAALGERAYPHLHWGEHLLTLPCTLPEPVLQGAAESVLDAIYRGEIALPPLHSPTTVLA